MRQPARVRLRMTTTTPRPRVIQTEHLDAAAAEWLKQRCELIVCPWEDAAQFDALLPSADALLIRTYTRVDAALLAKAPRLRCVARAGVGLDNVDVAACKARGVAVVSTPGANTRAVVELVTAFMLDALRPRVFLERALGKSEWNAARKDLVGQRQLSDLTLGIIGLGRVGSGVARVGRALDMRVVYHDLLSFEGERHCGGEPVGLERVLRESDVLTLHPDGRAGNRGLLGAKELAMCKRDVLLINTSRGFVVDAGALAAFLKANTSASAMLDVHEPEPIPADHPLLGIPNAHLSPHIGAATATAQANMSWVVKDLWQVLSGGRPENPAW